MSIDDNEVHQTAELDGRGVWGRENFIATAIWQKVYCAQEFSAKHFSDDHDFIVLSTPEIQGTCGSPILLPRNDGANRTLSTRTPTTIREVLWRPKQPSGEESRTARGCTP